eukprot:SAG31_NODE_6820_length_1878_cov_1.353569_1_plen_85_part_10
MRGPVLAAFHQLVLAMLNQHSSGESFATIKADLLPTLLSTLEGVLLGDKYRDGRSIDIQADLIALIGSHPHLLDFSMEKLVMGLL